MICFVLLLATLSIINTSTTPIERNRLLYYKYPEGIKENYQKYNYYGRPKSSYEFILHPQSYSSKRKDLTYDNLLNQTDEKIDSGSSFPTEGPTYSPDDGRKPASNIDEILRDKKSPTPRELHKELAALGVDYMAVMNTFEALYRSKQV